MTKQELSTLVTAYKERTRDALTVVYDALNNGQRKQLLKDEKVKALFDQFGVETD